MKKELNKINKLNKIAVLLSAYNGEKYIEQQIETILNQQCDCPIDIVVRDDGSSDNTISILQKYEEDNKILLIRGENVGVGVSFFKLLKATPGYDYYAFSDQDDCWNKDKLQRGIDAIRNVDNYALYCSNAEMCDENLIPLGRNVHRTMAYYNMERTFTGFASAQGCTCVFNGKLAEIIQNHEIPNNMVFHDSYLTSLCFALGGFFYADEYVSMKYRMHSKNAGGLNTRAQSGVINMINKRVKYIFTKPQRSISSQIQEILEQYNRYITKDAESFIIMVLEANNNLGLRMKLAMNRKLRDESLNLSISNRMKILFNNY